MSHLFSGRWQIDLLASTVWDDSAQAHVPDEVGQEQITIRDEAGAQDYEVLYGDSPVVRMGYTAKWDSPDWTPYVVREIVSTAPDLRQDIDAFKARVKATHGDAHRNFEVGEPYGLIRLVHVDDHTHYRLLMDPITRKGQAVMLRRLAPDQQSYMATVLDTRGIVHRRRRFIRC
jgi:hypothetical protein